MYMYVDKYIYKKLNYYNQCSPLMYVCLFSLELAVILGSLTRDMNPAYETIASTIFLSF